MDRLVEDKEFESLSEFTQTALTEFLLKIDLESEKKTTLDVLVKLLKTSEGMYAFCR